MRKIITKNKEIKLGMKHRVDSDDLPDDSENIKLTGNKDIDLCNLNLNIVKYELFDSIDPYIFIENCNINKLVLNEYKAFVIKNSTINDIYIQSEIDKLAFMNTNIPNFHGKVDLIDEIEINQ